MKDSKPQWFVYLLASDDLAELQRDLNAYLAKLGRIALYANDSGFTISSIDRGRFLAVVRYFYSEEII